MDQVEHGVKFVDSVCRFLADFFWVTGDAGDAAFHGSFGNGCGDGRSDAFVEGVGDDVVFGQFVIADRWRKTQPVSCLR